MSSDPLDIESTPLEHAIRAVMDALAGRESDLLVLDSRDRAVRQAVAAELLAASLDTDVDKQHRARELFIEYGYFDEAVRNLRDAESITDRTLAAQSLGILGSRLATTPLIAALFDSDSQVREAATLALNQIQDPSVVIGPVPDLTDDDRRELLGPEMSALDEINQSSQGFETGAEDALTEPVVYAADQTETSVDIQQLIAEETTIRSDIASREIKLNDLRFEQTTIDKVVQSSATREAKLRAEAAEFRGLEEAATAGAEAERVKRLEAERESLRLGDEISRLQSQVESLTQAAAERAQQRTKLEAARMEEAERARLLAQEVYDAELARLTSEQQLLLQQLTDLHKAADDVAARRAELDEARQKAEAETEELAAAHARMREAEARRRELEAERVQIETELDQRLEEGRRLVVEAEARLAEQKRIDEESRQHAAEVEKRIAELAEVRKQKELEETRLVEEEQSIRAELERLANAEAEARKRIEQAEVKRRTSEEAQRQAEEKAIKVEAEAHLRAVAEEDALAKLESIRRTVAAEAQSRADQEKRIKEEIEELRKLAEEERRRLEDETERRVQAETRLQQERERFEAQAAARLKANAEAERLKEQAQPQPASEQDRWRDDPHQNLRQVVSDPNVEILAPEPLAVEDVIAVSTGPEAIRSDLPSEDASKRASALAELVRLEGKNAFDAIVSAFDDQSPEVRNAAALALLEIDEERPVEWFTRAFEEASAERRQNIGLAIAGSGLAAEAVDSLSGGTREATYNALCVLFLMAKTGEVEPLVKAIEKHKDLEVRRAAIRLLTLSGQSEIADAAVKRRLNGNATPTVP